jgi:branched-chain amino acid transport system ATP-binding protein
MTLFALHDVGMRFGGLRALHRFSMQVQQGTIHALIGPNGAGKSTVFNCVSRFYQPTEGDILFEGRSLLRVSASGVAALGIARTFQNIELCRRLTVLENILVGMSSHIGG